MNIVNTQSISKDAYTLFQLSSDSFLQTAHLCTTQNKIPYPPSLQSRLHLKPYIFHPTNLRLHQRCLDLLSPVSPGPLVRLIRPPLVSRLSQSPSLLSCLRLHRLSRRLALLTAVPRQCLSPSVCRRQTLPSVVACRPAHSLLCISRQRHLAVVQLQFLFR
jgi:hypothetical protein